MPIYGNQPRHVSLPRRTRRRLPAGLRPQNQQQPQTTPSIGQSVMDWAGATGSQPALAPGRQTRPAVSPFGAGRGLGAPLRAGMTPFGTFNPEWEGKTLGELEDQGVAPQTPPTVFERYPAGHAPIAAALGSLRSVVPRPYEEPLPPNLDQNGNPVQVPQKTTGPGILRNPIHAHIGQGFDAFRKLGQNAYPFIGLDNLNSPGSPALEMATTEAMLKSLPTGRFSPQVGDYLRDHPYEGTGDRLNQLWQDAHDEALEARMNQNGANAIQGRTRRILSQLDQPQQRLDGAAALQGRLTATGRPYPTHIDQGPQQPSFQPREGTLSGGSTVTIDPETGRAIVQGHMDERRMNALGIREVPVYEQVGDYGQRQVGTRRDDSRMLLRQAFSRRRQENELLARRLGQSEEYTPGAPAPLTADTEQLQAGLGALRADRNKLSDLLRRRILERQGRPNIPSFLMDEDSPQQATANPELDQAVLWNNQFTQTHNRLLAAGTDPAIARQEAEAVANRTYPDGAREGAASGNDDARRQFHFREGMALTNPELPMNQRVQQANEYADQVLGERGGETSASGGTANPVQAQQRLSSQGTTYQSVLGVLEAEPDESIESIARRIINRQRSGQPLSTGHLRDLQGFFRDRRSVDPESFPGLERGFLASTASLPQYFVDELVNGNDVSQALRNAERRLNADAARGPSPFRRYQPIPRS